MSSSTHNVNVDTTQAGKSKTRSRRKKLGNSQEFNEILSRVNGISVSERIRLTKSLAGQLGFVTYKPNGASTNGERSQGSSVKKREKAAPTFSRPNPLKNTVFEADLNLAKQELKAAKERAGGVALPASDLAVVKYTVALTAYKAEKMKLVLVDEDVSRQKRDRSPEPAAAKSAKQKGSGSQKGKGFVNRVTSVFSGNAGKEQNASASQDATMKE
jgi:hypothetical protein